MKNIPMFTDFLNEENLSIEPLQSFEVIMPDTYDLKWTISDYPTDDKTLISKKYDFEYQINHTDSSITGTKIKSSLILAISDDSTGVFSLAKDVEKFSGLTLKDAKKYNETAENAYIYGLCNTMNGGADIFFWTNGKRLGGQAKKQGAMSAILEQLSHEAGVHLTRQILVRMIAVKNNVSIDNEDWITYDYGFGEYCWPAIGDPNDKTPKIIAIDEETFATTNGAIVSMLVEGFFDMASKYVPGLPIINTK
jgi:hypothetical protein